MKANISKNIINLIRMPIEFDTVHTLNFMHVGCFEVTSFQNKILPIEYVGMRNDDVDTIFVVLDMLDAIKLVYRNRGYISLESVYTPCFEEVRFRKNKFGNSYMQFSSLRSIGNFTKLIIKGICWFSDIGASKRMCDTCAREDTCASAEQRTMG